MPYVNNSRINININTEDFHLPEAICNDLQYQIPQNNTLTFINYIKYTFILEFKKKQNYFPINMKITFQRAHISFTFQNLPTVNQCN